MNRRANPIRRDLAASTGDGTAFSLMVGLGETYVPAFALALGLGGVETGLLASVPLIVGALLQVVAPRAIALVGSARRWVIGCATLQALSFVPLVWGALAGRLPAAGLFAIVAFYWAAGLASGPAWNVWMETLVPRRLRPRFFAVRSRFAHAAVLTGFLVGGVLLAATAHAGRPLVGFAALFAAAALARAVSAAFLARHREPVVPEVRIVPPRELVARVRATRSGTLLGYMILLQVTVYLAAPYFTPYMLGPLGLSYGEYAVLTGAAFAARVAVFPLLGRVAERFGARTLLFWGGFSVAPVAALWTLSDAFAYLFVLQVLSGIAWGAFELSTLLLFFETIPRAERVSILTAFNVANAGALVTGALLGGALLAGLQETPGAYATVFVVSSALRLLAALLLFRLPAVHVTVRRVVTRTVAVRPYVGAIERPILAAVPRRPPAPDGGGTTP
ncbi:MAG: MFS transporter [Planctomycetes bacterium]|nr:MFS transporter [Planctomycetota bacterium]